MSINQIAKDMQAPMGVIWHAVSGLEKNKLVTRPKSRIQITQEGRLFLLHEDIHTSGHSRVDNLNRLGAPGGPTLFTMLQNAWENDGDVLVIPIILISVALLLLLLIPLSNDLYLIVLLVLVLMFLGIYLRFAIRNVPEHMRFVIFRYGMCIGERGPGPLLLIPLTDLVYQVDMRVRSLEIPHGTCLTKDKVTVSVDVVLYWQVKQAEWFLTQMTNPNESLRLLATAQLREVIDHFSLHEIQAQREQINDTLRQKLNNICAVWCWGVSVTAAKIREITPPPEVISAMQLEATAELKSRAAKAEAEGYHAAQVKKADADAIALEKLNKVAITLDDKLLLLRYLDTLSELGKSPSTKLVLPMELIDLTRAFAERLRSAEVSSPPRTTPHDGHQGK
jgi:regulator of protease activity HflC (stomatin/prohibitin superfamily)